MNEDQKCLTNEPWSQEAGIRPDNLLAQIIRSKNERNKPVPASENLYWNLDSKYRALDEIETNATTVRKVSFVLYPGNKMPQAINAKVLMPRESKN
jgi:hypothetical protein